MKVYIILSLIAMLLAVLSPLAHWPYCETAAVILIAIAVIVQPK